MRRHVNIPTRIGDNWNDWNWSLMQRKEIVYLQFAQRIGKSSVCAKCGRQKELDDSDEERGAEVDN